MATRKGKALITGASAGMGRDMAKELAHRGYDLILVARRRDRLEALRSDLSVDVRIEVLDLSQEEQVMALCERLSGEKIEILVNNAGFGLFGSFLSTSLEEELEMISLNIRAVHILLKHFIPKIAECGGGYVLNVASSAAFTPGPMMSTYYATKSYVLRLGEAVREELRQERVPVKICTLCPGPVRTEFNRRAGASFMLHGLTSEAVSAYAIRKMFQGRRVIVPGFVMKVGRVAMAVLPNRWILPIVYRFSHQLTE